jgi:Glycosyltransferase 61
MMHSVSMKDIAFERIELLPRTPEKLSSCIVGHNYDQLPDPLLKKTWQEFYATRQLDHPSVELVRFPKGIKLFGGRNFLLLADQRLVEEQIPPRDVLSDPGSIASMAAETAERIQVNGECLLVSRYGVMVWGHWMGELLPRILLAERAFPGRFTYVLPQDLFNASAPRNVWNSLWETIRLLGVNKERLFLAWYDKHYVFADLYGVTSIIWQDAFHPGALQQMRDAFLPYGESPLRRRSRKVAILRTESPARNVSNLDEVISILKREDFDFVEIGRIPVAEQIHLFSTADTIVGVLASGLTGLFFSPYGVRVLSLGPQGYRNPFFYAIMQSRGARYYDLRGKITKLDPRSEIFSDFEINTSELAKGLEVLSPNVTEVANPT